jgi:preprotein translocase subunit SecE
MAKLIENTKRFIKEVRIELNKVTWPSREELKGSTILVIIVSVFFAVYIGIIDMLLSYLRQIWM